MSLSELVLLELGRCKKRRGYNGLKLWEQKLFDTATKVALDEVTTLRLARQCIDALTQVKPKRRIGLKVWETKIQSAAFSIVQQENAKHEPISQTNP